MMAVVRNLLPNIVTGILVLCALTVTALSIHQYLASRHPELAQAGRVDNWRQLVAGRPTNLGSENAHLKIIEFSDYQCPFCRQIDPNLEALVKKMPGKVAIVRFDLPLKQIHPYAYKAAIASRCAAVQGIYEPYEKELFQENLSSADWLGFARRANVPDLSQFSACVSGDETAPLVEADIKTANSLGITSTPILIINGQTFPGAQSEQALEQMVSDNE